MPTACVLLAEGFEEIEAVTVIDVLRRAGVEVESVAVGEMAVEGAHGIRVAADIPLEKAVDSHWDLLVLPGGMPGSETLRDNPDVQAFIVAQREQSGLIAAICAAPIALGRAGVLEGAQATCYPGFEDQLAGAQPRQEAVVIDGGLVTSRGPGTAMGFALTLVELLCGPECAKKLAQGMLV